MIWLRAVLALKMRPAATGLTTRVTRTITIYSSTLHFGKIAECVGM
jgi:hypothetical protein